ncbi:hypothetical protein BD769DRAFT_1676894 [Suillus cothurnatus]|nr:hypothetical protein BD769DRAFT_1676894 [Suillus cothurnatus]
MVERGALAGLGSGAVAGVLARKRSLSVSNLLAHAHILTSHRYRPFVAITLTLKATVLYPYDNQDCVLLNSIVECQIARDADAGHAQFAEYAASKMVAHLNDAVQHLQLVLDQFPVDHPDQAAALTNLT